MNAIRPSNAGRLGGLRIAVAGAGVFGLCVGVLAADAGARVTVFDPRPLGQNASGVAAGMLSPALEAALDPDEAAYALLEEAFQAWPAFAASLGLEPPPALHAGALYLDAPAALDRLQARLDDLAAPWERLRPKAARALQPALSDRGLEAVHVQADGRVPPLALLARLRGRIADLGGEVVSAPCPMRPLGFDAVVVAAGYDSRRWSAAAPSLATLRPIKGHVLHFEGGPSGGPTLRSPEGYAAPQAQGLVFGASMEPGRSDETLDGAIVGRLHAAAANLLPGLATAPFQAPTGVRAATPDGRPLVGRVEGGLHLATGGRRNGWLLAPLVARAVLEGLQGSEPRAEFAPGRFEGVFDEAIAGPLPPRARLG